MPFQGFQTKYPEYEVVTPQTHLSFTLRTLNVQDEEHLKGSLLTTVKLTEHLNKCIYETLVKKPDTIKEYKDFLKLVTLKDRDALLYGLYHITYEEVRNYDVMCKNCKKEFPVTIMASNTFNFNPYPSKDVLTKRVKVELKKTKGVFAYIKQPTLFDEDYAMKSLTSTPGVTNELITETLIIDRFEEILEDATEPTVISDRIDVIDAYRSLPAKDKRDIYEGFKDNFGQYEVSLKMQAECQFCGTKGDFDIDLVENFFRMVYTS